MRFQQSRRAHHVLGVAAVARAFADRHRRRAEVAHRHDGCPHQPRVGVDHGAGVVLDEVRLQQHGLSGDVGPDGQQPLAHYRLEAGVVGRRLHDGHPRVAGCRERVLVVERRVVVIAVEKPRTDEADRGDSEPDLRASDQEGAPADRHQRATVIVSSRSPVASVAQAKRDVVVEEGRRIEARREFGLDLGALGVGAVRREAQREQGNAERHAAVLDRPELAQRRRSHRRRPADHLRPAGR